MGLFESSREKGSEKSFASASLPSLEISAESAGALRLRAPRNPLMAP